MNSVNNYPNMVWQSLPQNDFVITPWDFHVGWILVVVSPKSFAYHHVVCWNCPKLDHPLWAKRKNQIDSCVAFFMFTLSFLCSLYVNSPSFYVLSTTNTKKWQGSEAASDSTDWLRKIYRKPGFFDWNFGASNGKIQQIHPSRSMIEKPIISPLNQPSHTTCTAKSR